MISTATSMQESARLVKVICGPSQDVFHIAGASVDSVRTNLADAFNIAPNALPFVGREQVPESHQLQASDVLEFVQQRGRKAGIPRFTEKGLNGLGLTVDGNQAVRLEDAIPDQSWTLSRLLTYAKERIASSKSAEKESILQANKSAVELFRAGAALSVACAKCKELGHGEWAKWKAENDLAHTTVNDAIRLYKSAKTEEALNGLGITEAKEKFVYPSKSDDHDQDDEQASTAVTPTKDKTAATPQDTTTSDGAADADTEEADERSPEDCGPRANEGEEKKKTTVADYKQMRKDTRTQRKPMLPYEVTLTLKFTLAVPATMNKEAIIEELESAKDVKLGIKTAFEKQISDVSVVAVRSLNKTLDKYKPETKVPNGKK